jgi:hypothetical protein
MSMLEIRRLCNVEGGTGKAGMIRTDPRVFLSSVGLVAVGGEYVDIVIGIYCS